MVRKAAVFLVFSILILFSGCIGDENVVDLIRYQGPSATAQDVDTQVIEEEIFVLLNEQRLREGVPMFQWNEKVAELARVRSKDPSTPNIQESLMAEQMYFESADELLNLTEYSGNMAYNLVREWMRDLDKRQVILTAEWDTIGVGVNCVDADKRIICYSSIYMSNFVFTDAKRILRDGHMAYDLYNRNPEILYPATIDLTFTVDEKATLYILEDYDSYLSWLNNDPADKKMFQEVRDEFNTQIEVCDACEYDLDDLFVVWAPDATIEYTIEMKYNPDTY